MRIQLAQSRISVLVDIGRVARDGGGSGGLANYMVSRQDDKPEILTELAVRKAEAAIQPLRVALADFDIASMALNAGHVGISAVDWFKAGPVEEEREPRLGNPSDFVAAAPGNQAALMSVGHFLSSDLSRVEIRAEISLFTKATAGSKDPVALGHQRILCIMQLAQPSLDDGENIRRWSADHAALARRALTDGYASLARMIPRSLMLTHSDVAAFEMKSRAKTFLAGSYGRVIERDGAELRSILLWDKGLVTVQTVTVAAH